MEAMKQNRMKGIACLLSFAACSEMRLAHLVSVVLICNACISLYAAKYTALHLWDAAGYIVLKEEKKLGLYDKTET